MKLIDAQTLAQLLDVSPRTVYDWAYKKKIPYHKLGRLLRFNEDEIDYWLRRNRMRVNAKPNQDNNEDKEHIS